MIAEETSIETKVEAEAPVEAPKPAIEDIAAHDYMTLIPQFDLKLEEMSNRQLKKVVSVLMKYPFSSTEIPKWSYLQEQELFNIGMKINDCKFVLMKTVFDMKKEHIEELAKEQNIELPKQNETV